MRNLLKRFLHLCLLLLLCAGLQPLGEPAAKSIFLSENDVKLYKKAFKAAHRRQFNKAMRFAEVAENTLPAKAIRWMYLKGPKTGAAFADIASFLEKNSSWPQRRYLIRRAEEKFPKDLSPTAVLSWFDKHPPISGVAAARKAQALIDTGQKKTGKSQLQKAWIHKNFGRREALSFLRKYRKYLSISNHAARLDRLLWDDNVYAARRQLRLVDRNRQYLGQARIQLIRRGPGVDYSVGKVQPNFRNDPGLIYDRVRWRRRNGLMKTAYDLLKTAPTDNLMRPDKWGLERRLIARWALQNGKIQTAYNLISDHGQTGYAERAEAEWFAGWIALRFLKRHVDAFQHFKKLFKLVRYPISRARAAYWAGRAADAGGNAAIAVQWYRVAATHSTRFYGQLAAIHLSPKERLSLPSQPTINKNKITKFWDKEITQIVVLLAQIGEKKLVKKFLNYIIRNNKDPDLWVAIGDLANAAERGDYAIRAARYALRQGVPLIDVGYPELKTRLDNDLDPTLINGLVRQESAFYKGAVSRAGARGLMQLMPGTAYRVARKMRVPYSKARLTRDPAYNVRLGQYYLKKLLTRYNGSEILALAAYNAGPGAVNRWIRRSGRPGPSILDKVDWIEKIPYKETRNYVQRVLENRIVYQNKGSSRKILITLGERKFEMTQLRGSPPHTKESMTSSNEHMSVLAAPTSSEGISTLFEDKIRRFNKAKPHKGKEQGIEKMGEPSTEVFEENSEDGSNDSYYSIFK